MTKIYIERVPGLRRVPFWASPQTTLDLATLRDRYSAIIGREVSTTIIVRRALEALAQKLQTAKPGPEMAALLKHVL